jgi:hypothetical protein
VRQWDQATRESGPCGEIEVGSRFHASALRALYERVENRRGLSAAP